VMKKAFKGAARNTNGAEGAFGTLKFVKGHSVNISTAHASGVSAARADRLFANVGSTFVNKRSSSSLSNGKKVGRTTRNKRARETKGEGRIGEFRDGMKSAVIAAARTGRSTFEEHGRKKKAAADERCNAKRAETSKLAEERTAEAYAKTVRTLNNDPICPNERITSSTTTLTALKGLAKKHLGPLSEPQTEKALHAELDRLFDGHGLSSLKPPKFTFSSKNRARPANIVFLKETLFEVYRRIKT
jgi:hypothetical protein